MDGARAGVAPLAPTYREVATVDRLRGGWHRVWRNNGSFGGDGQCISEFREDPHAEIARLHDELVDRGYRPHQLRGVRIPKADGTSRRLLIPSVRDRVVQQAALSLLGPWFDATFESSSWAYRPGRSHTGALAMLTNAWKAGYRCGNCLGVVAAKPPFSLAQPTGSTPWIL